MSIRTTVVSVVAAFLSVASSFAQSGARFDTTFKAGDYFAQDGLVGVVRQVAPDHIEVQPEGAAADEYVIVPIPIGRAPFIWPGGNPQSIEGVAGIQ
jgi:hypothetical protein